MSNSSDELKEKLGCTDIEGELTDFPDGWDYDAWLAEQDEKEAEEGKKRIGEFKLEGLVDYMKRGDYPCAIVYQDNVKFHKIKPEDATLTSIQRVMGYRDAVLENVVQWACLAARMAIAMGLKAGIAQYSDKDIQEDYTKVVVIELPSGIVSCRVPDWQIKWFNFLGEWDGDIKEVGWINDAEVILDPRLTPVGK